MPIGHILEPNVQQNTHKNIFNTCYKRKAKKYSILFPISNSNISYFKTFHIDKSSFTA